MIFQEAFDAIFGFMIIGTWYIETYLDATFSSNSRIITSWMSSSARDQATTHSLVGPGFFICNLGGISYKLGFHCVMTGIPTAVDILCLLIVAIYHFFPLSVPRWVDVQYQYMKHHEVLDENGDPLPQFESSESGEESVDNDQGQRTP